MACWNHSRVGNLGAEVDKWVFLKATTDGHFWFKTHLMAIIILRNQQLMAIVDLMAKTQWISVVFSVNFQTPLTATPLELGVFAFFALIPIGQVMGRMDQPLSHFNRTKHCLNVTQHNYRMTTVFKKHPSSTLTRNGWWRDDETMTRWRDYAWAVFTLLSKTPDLGSVKQSLRRSISQTWSIPLPMKTALLSRASSKWPWGVPPKWQFTAWKT